MLQAEATTCCILENPSFLKIVFTSFKLRKLRRMILVPVSHLGPVLVGGHSHDGIPLLIRHVPPWRHLKLPHSSESGRNYKNINFNSDYMGRWYFIVNRICSSVKIILMHLLYKMSYFCFRVIKFLTIILPVHVLTNFTLLFLF